MAFLARTFKIDRADFNDSSLSQGPAFHEYVSPDTIDQISTLGYFPPYFGYDFNSVVANDILTAYSTTDFEPQAFLITSANPLVLIPLTPVVSTAFQSFSIQSQLVGIANIILPLTLSRDANGVISAFLTSTLTFTTTGTGTLTFAPFVLPSIFIPEQASVSLPLTATLSPPTGTFVTLQLIITSSGILSLNIAPGLNFVADQTYNVFPSTSMYFGSAPA